MIADRLAVVVNARLRRSHSAIPPATASVATCVFAFQIYCDFSGYSDIALGAAQVMGFTLMKNFDRPYFRDVDRGVLAPLAHLAVHLVPRLPVRPARRAAGRAPEPRSQSARRVHDQSGSGTGRLDVRGLGSSARRLSGVFGGDEPVAAAVGRGVAPESPGLGIDRAPDRRHVQPRVVCLDLLPRQVTGRRQPDRATPRRRARYTVVHPIAVLASIGGGVSLLTTGEVAWSIVLVRCCS